MKQMIAHRHAGAPWSKVTANSIVGIVQETCSVDPEKAALVFEDGLVLTRREFLVYCERFAAALRRRIAPGDRVAVMLGNRAEYFFSVFGIAANRGVLVSINPTAQEVDAGYILRDSEAKFVIVEPGNEQLAESLAPDCPALREILCVDADEPRGLVRFGSKDERLPFSEAPCRRDDPVTIYYTSGTTGLPKGCILHNEWWLRVVDIDLRMNPDGREKPLGCLPFYYADPTIHLLQALQAGGTLVKMRKFSVSRYWDVVQAHGVTKLHTIASMPLLLLKGTPKPAEREHSIHHASCAGIPHNMHKLLIERFNTIWFDNYGSTEAGICCRMPLEHAIEMAGSGSMGVPAPEVTIRIADDKGKEVPLGETGEMLIRGPAMFQGYLNKPEATAEAMRDGWYHTGDLACRDERGFIFFLGRSKDIIRRSGENMAAAEIEAVLRLHPKIIEAAVIAVPDEIRGEEAKAYILLRESESPESLAPRDIVEFCGSKLAAYKIPRYIEYRTEDFPRTPSMKVQKEQLKKEKSNLLEGVWDREKHA